MEAWAAIPRTHVHLLGMCDKRCLDRNSGRVNRALPKNKFVCLQSHFSLAPFCVARLVRLPLSWRVALTGVSYRESLRPLRRCVSIFFPLPFLPFLPFRLSTVDLCTCSLCPPCSNSVFSVLSFSSLATSHPFVCLYFIASLLLCFSHVWQAAPSRNGIGVIRRRGTRFDAAGALGA